MSKREKDNFFQPIIKHSSDAVLVFDNKGIIRFLNPAAESLFNRRAEQMIGQVFGFPIHKGGSKEKDDTRCSKKERGTPKGKPTGQARDERRGTKDERIYHPSAAVVCRLSEAVVRRLSAAVVCRVSSKRVSRIDNPMERVVG